MNYGDLKIWFDKIFNANIFGVFKVYDIIIFVLALAIALTIFKILYKGK